MIGGSEQFEEYICRFSETEEYFIAHLDTINIYFKKKDNESYLLKTIFGTDFTILTKNTTMDNKLLSCHYIDHLWKK